MPIEGLTVEDLLAVTEHELALADDLSPLLTFPEVLGYVVAQARQEGWDEADAVELVVRAGQFSRDAVRAAERVLRPLGYVAVCDRLRELARHKRAGRMSKSVPSPIKSKA